MTEIIIFSEIERPHIISAIEDAMDLLRELARETRTGDKHDECICLIARLDLAQRMVAHPAEEGTDV